MNYGNLPGQGSYGGGGYGGYSGGYGGYGNAPNYMNYGSGGVGSNQYQNMPPWMNAGTAYNSPGIVPQQGTQNSPYYGPGWTGAGGGPIVGGGNFSIEQSMDPQLQQGFFNFLQSNIGKGATPFNLSATLPWGGATQPGQLNAPTNPVLQQLIKAFGGQQSNIPGMNALQQIANQGIDATPEWQKMIAAQQQNIGQGRANLMEQMGYMGNLAGSPGATGLANYDEQTVATQNAQLAQLQQENILQGQIPAAQYLAGGAQNFGQYLQGLGQQNIQNVQNEQIRTSPFYSPLLGMQYGASTSFNPVLNRSNQTGGNLWSMLF